MIRQDKKILIVEDNPLNMELLKDILEAQGYQIVQAYNSEEALTLLKVAKPDLIVMDIQLPGMDGLTLTRLLKEKEGFKDIPIVAVTAHTMKGDRERALAAGCNGYISKPINIKLFSATIADFLFKGTKLKDSRDKGFKGSNERIP